MFRGGRRAQHRAESGGGRRGVVASGSSMALSMLIVSVAGFATWTVAARSMPVEEVGRLTGFVNGMMLVSGAAQLGLGLAVARFVPAAGRLAGRVLAAAYGAMVLSVLVVSAVYLLTPSGRTVTEGMPAGWLVLTGTAVLWSLFALQSQALGALGRARWAPPASAVFSAVRLGMLLVLAPMGVFAATASWWVPCALSLLVVGFLLRRGALPEFAGVEPDLPGRRQVARYAGSSWVASVWATLFFSGLPLLVLQRDGAAVSAVFAVLWVIYQTMDNVGARFGGQLIVAVAREPGALRRSVRSLTRLGALAAPALVVLVVVAPWVLALFGDRYAAEGGTALRLLAVAFAFRLVQVLQVAVWRATDRTWAVVGVQAFQLVPPVVALLTGWAASLTDLALVVLATQVVLAVPCTAGLLRVLRPRASAGVPAPRSREAAEVTGEPFETTGGNR
ncbi:hypothetical protein GCM10009528_03810 [Kineococcus aurantiacus]